MTLTPKNAAQLFYGRHFPEILTKEPDPETKEYSVKNPLNSYKNEMKIEDIGMFTASNPPYRGFITDFLTLAEGTSEDEAFEEVEKIKENNLPPTLADIQKWHAELLSPAGKTLLDYLTMERGLTDTTIKKYLLGFNEPDNEFVFPALNITRQNTICVKFIKFPILPTPAKNNIRVVGPSYLLGYHKLRFNREHKIPKYITINEIDALYLRQLGFETYCSITDYCDLQPNWYQLFKDLNIIIVTSYDDESLVNTYEFAKNNVKSIKRVNLKEDHISDYFIKGKKTITDFNNEVITGQVLNSHYFESLSTLRIAESNQDSTKHINGPQDFSSSGFIYGAIIGGGYYFLSSERTFWIEKRLNEECGLYRKNDFDYSGITAELATKFTQEYKSVTALNVFNAVKRYVKKYFFFKDELIYDILTIWSMGTYVFSIFRHYPYVHLQAEKNSGKSQLMEILKCICFNGKYYIDPTGAVIFREADRNLPSMFIDESENLHKRSGHNSLMELLNSGFQKGASVTRTAAKGSFINYSVYCPKMFAGINDMNDVLQSRSIHIKVLRKLPEEKVNRYTEDAITASLQKNLREDLYMFGLQYAGGVRDIYNNKIDSIEKLQSLENRQHDIWSPIFVIASIIDQEENSKTQLTNSLLSYVESQKEIQAEKDSAENPTSKILIKLDEVLKLVPPKKRMEKDGEIILEYLTESLFEEFKKDPDWKKELGSKNKLTGLLRKVEVYAKNENIEGKTVRCYIIDVTKLIEFGKRYGVQFTFNK